MKTCTSKWMKAFFAFILPSIAGFAPVLSASTTTSPVSVSIASDTPVSCAPAAVGSTDSPVIACAVTSQKAFQADVFYVVYGPVSGAYLDDGSTRYDPVWDWTNTDGSHSYEFDPAPVSTGTKEFTLRVHVASYGAGQTIQAALTVLYDVDDAAQSANTWIWGNTILVTANTPPPSALANLSARGMVSANNPLVAGLVVLGDSGVRRDFLIRGIGPTLGQFGVGNALTDPVLVIYDEHQKIVATDDNWSDDVGAAKTASTAMAVGAFSLPQGSKDAATVVSLAPGSYTVQVTGAGGSSGTALVEVYKVSR